MTDLSLFLIILVWGVNYSVVKAALAHFLPLSFNGIRFIIATTILFFIIRRSKPSFPKSWKEWLWILMVGILGDLFYQVLFIEGIHMTLAGDTSLILATTPVFVALFAHLLGYEKVNSRMWLGIAASFLGITFVIFGKGESLNLSSKTLQGDFIEAAASVLWSLYVVLSTPLVRRYGSVVTSASTLWVGSIFLVLASIPSLMKQNWHSITWLDWGAVIFSGVFSIAIGQTIWYQGIAKIGNARTSAYSNFTPLVGLFVAWPLLGEVPRFLQLMGAATILLGVFLTRLGRISLPRREEIPAAE